MGEVDAVLAPAGPQVHAGTEPAATPTQHDAGGAVGLRTIERLEQLVSWRGVNGVVGVRAVEDEVGDARRTLHQELHYG
jgi:hypothetical protein